VIVPLLAWQNDQLEIIHGKLRQLSKLELLIGSRSEFADSYQNLSKVLKKAKVDFHSDDDSTKLLIQRQIEDVLSNNDVTVEGFQWVLDESGLVRVLRASIKIKGREDGVVKTLWDLARLPKIVNQVGWTLRFNNWGPASSAGTNGNLILEFFALDKSDIGPESKVFGSEVTASADLKGTTSLGGVVE
jgi:hypothetical protein